MGSNFTYTPIVTGYNPNKIEKNFSDIEIALDDTLSRSGQTPNQMLVDFDMNGNDVLNASSIFTDKLILDGQSITTPTSILLYRSSWVGSTSYSKNDIVKFNNEVYIALENHTSTVFNDDLTSNKWELLLPKGVPGSGTGDLIASNNLSDVDSVSQTRINLGLNIGSDVQPYSSSTALTNTPTTWTENLLVENDKFLFYNSGSPYRYGLVGYSSGGGAITHNDSSNVQQGNILVWNQTTASGPDELSLNLKGSRAYTFYDLAQNKVTDVRGVLNLNNVTQSVAGFVGDEEVQVLYDSATDGIVTSVESPILLDGYNYNVCVEEVAHNTTTTQALRLFFYKETDNAYTTHFTVNNVDQGSVSYCDVDLKNLRRDTKFKTITGNSFSHVTQAEGVVTFLSTSDIFGAVKMATSQKISRIKFEWESSSFNAGRIILFRTPMVN